MRACVVSAVGGGVTVCHTMSTTKRAEENCSNVSNSLSTSRRKDPRDDDKSLMIKVVLDWY